jgi:hypothetical protein
LDVIELAETAGVRASYDVADSLDISAMFSKISNVRLRGGVVGKVSTVLISVCAASAIISWSVRLWWISLIAIVGLLGLCYRMLNRLIDFADKNPHAALFEGAEFLAHERLQLGTKAVPELSAVSSPPQPPPIQPTLTQDSESSETTEN